MGTSQGRAGGGQITILAQSRRIGFPQPAGRARVERHLVGVHHSVEVAPSVGGSLKYRPDIDGLRGVAVLAVLLFHYGVPAVSGGFVGVDVFFVISGYLITGLLVQRLPERVGQVRGWFIDFYSRRARRILPALLFI